ncbi:MAG: FAD:protein FMN transferase [Prevotellaceae bacterium]|jgi:thiamine biosynthesis lipoprotein|nr:FAD:protein FMN transferase [Prevotellaceae bacterium]
MKKVSFLIILPVLFIFASCGGNKEKKYISISDKALGTFYNITYFDENGRNLQPAIDSLLNRFDMSLSAYNPNSIISKVNQNIDVELDEWFQNVFAKAKYFYEITDGAFDISASPLFSAWGFGFGNKEKITPELIDSLKQFTGMEKINIVDGKTVKSDPRVNINANALAKGYAVDVVANFLLSLQIKNFLIEIGGEISVRGKNKDGENWKIGIDKPGDGNFNVGETLINTIQLTDKAIATSGNYRQFYIDGGKKYAHTIDPLTGYPVQHSLLSATVVAADCMSADAAATSLMVMGIEKAKTFLNKHPEYQAYLIYEENDEYKEYSNIADN